MFDKIIQTCILILMNMLASHYSIAAIQQSGWQEMPGTDLKSVCPAKGFNGTDYNFSFYCQNVTAAWNGGAFDSKRNRLYIWGGGHTDYMGNEMYALDIDQGKMQRLTAPATPIAESMPDKTPSELMPFDGSQPNSRHVYDAMVYIPGADRVWTFSGSLAMSGKTDRITWIFNPNTNAWKRVQPKGQLPQGNYGIVSAYNPNTGKVVFHDQRGLYTYQYSEDGGVYTRLVSDQDYGIHLSAEFDPERNVFVMIGGGQAFYYDLSPGKSHVRRRLNAKGDTEIINSQGPGLVYDPQLKQLVAWAGGNKVYMLDMDNRIWTAVSQPGEPGPAICNGTYGRWAYSAKSGKYVVYNWYENNAYALRLPVQSRQSPKKANISLNSDSGFTQKSHQTILQPQPKSTLLKAVNATRKTDEIQHIQMTPSSDTYLNVHHSVNGNEPVLLLSTGHRVLLRFSNTELNHNQQVKRAILRLYQRQARPMSPIYTGVYLGSHGWAEDSNWYYSNLANKTVWKEAPGDWMDRSGIEQGGQPFDLQQVNVNSDGQWLEWDVTDLVKHWQTDVETEDLGIVLTSLSGQDKPIELSSRESENIEYHPSLMLEFAKIPD